MARFSFVARMASEEMTMTIMMATMTIMLTMMTMTTRMMTTTIMLHIVVQLLAMERCICQPRSGAAVGERAMFKYPPRALHSLCLWAL